MALNWTTEKNICFNCERETASCFAIAKANFSRVIGSEKRENLKYGIFQLFFIYNAFKDFRH